MDADRFDALSRALITSGSRRATLGALLGSLLGGVLHGPSLEVLATARKGNSKRQRHAGSKHDRQPDRHAGGEGRHTHSRQDRHRPRSQDVTAEQRPEASGELAEPQRGEMSASDVSADSHCLPPGAKKCFQPSDCCSGRCKRKKKKCLGCLKGTEYCPTLEACVDDPSQCVVACATGSADCDGDGVCETDTTSSTQHCGGCNNPCGANQTCVNSTCGGGLTCSPCSGDKVCNASTGFCACPADKPVQCEFNSTRCSADPNTDVHRCGLNCVDCEVSFAPGYHCCGGQCVNGCGPSTNGSCADGPCGASCTPCPTGKFCCNLGPGTSSQCVDPVAGFCPSLAT